MPSMNAPTDLPNLQSWISSSQPYHNINHTSTSFIDVNDFTTTELEAAFGYATHLFDDKHSELKAALKEAAKIDNFPDDVMSHAAKTLSWAASNPISQIPSQQFQQIAIAAKFADDLTYQNCLVGLAVRIRRLKDEIAKLEHQQKGRPAEQGDEDDWFLVGRDEVEQMEQERLYAEIEIRLDAGLVREGRGAVEEGDIEVMYVGA